MAGLTIIGLQFSLELLEVVCYTAVFSVVRQRSSPLRDDPKNGCVADYTRRGSHIFGILGDQKIQVGRDLKVGRFLLH